MTLTAAIPPGTLVPLTRRLAAAADALAFAPPVAFVYNPLVYAREPLEPTSSAGEAERRSFSSSA